MENKTTSPATAWNAEQHQPFHRDTLPASTTWQWSRARPTAPGIFILLRDGQGPCECVAVKHGDWTKAQNPEWLYAGPDVITAVNGWWCGPVSRPPCSGMTIWEDLN